MNNSAPKLPRETTIEVKKWKNTDHFKCPNCGAELTMETRYVCNPCNVKVRVIVRM